MYCVFNQKLFEWHRCEIIRINHSDISIFYIDIGSVDLVSIKSLKTLKVFKILTIQKKKILIFNTKKGLL